MNNNWLIAMIFVQFDADLRYLIDLYNGNIIVII